MSSLGDDAHLHYCDNSHKWLAPPGVDQASWAQTVAAHVERHRATMGGPPAPVRGPACAVPVRHMPAGRPRRAAADPSGTRTGARG